MQVFQAMNVQFDDPRQLYIAAAKTALNFDFRHFEQFLHQIIVNNPQYAAMAASDACLVERTKQGLFEEVLLFVNSLRLKMNVEPLSLQ